MARRAESVKEYIESAEPSPKVRLAVRLWMTGAVKTKAEAARVAGITPQYLTMVTSSNRRVQQIMDSMDVEIHTKAVDLHTLLASLSQEAIDTIAVIMRGSDSELLKFKAAQDLADRGPETSKVQKHQLAAITIAGEDAKALARAMIESTKSRVEHEHVVEGYSDVEDLDAVLKTNVPLHLQEGTDVKHD